MNQNKSIRFSIIIPVFNRSDCIARCLESVVSQRYNDYEIIVIDDGSTDNTLEVIQNRFSFLKFVQIIHYKSNRGVNYARNCGLKQATGEFIVFLDSDDQLSTDALYMIDIFIKQYPKYHHYLFRVSDRNQDPNLPKSIHEFNYKDWLSEIIGGDFMHVIRPCCFEGLPFVEEFRMYETLNWLRILKRNNNQLFIPWTSVERERGRKDSVTREAELNNRVSLLNSYNFLFKFINWYFRDYSDNDLLNVLNKKIRRAIIIGISINETEQNNRLIKLLPRSYIKFIFSILNVKFLSPIVYFLLLRYTQFHKRFYIILP